jgi:hypothetical protein
MLMKLSYRSIVIGILLVGPMIAWFIITQFVPLSGYAYVACMASVAMGSILLTLLFIQSMNKNPKVHPYARLLAIACVTVVPLIILFSGLRPASGSGVLTRSPVTAAGITPKLTLRPVTPEESSGIVRFYDSQRNVARWATSPRQRTITIDRSRIEERQRLVMNGTFAQSVQWTVVSGSFGIGCSWPLSLVQNPSDSGEWLSSAVARWHSAERLLLDEAPHALHLVWNHSPAERTEPERTIQVRFWDLQDEDGAAVVRTEAQLKAGDVVLWGLIPTHYNRLPLKVEGRIVFLDSVGNYYRSETAKGTPKIWTGTAAAPSNKLEDQADCVTPIHALNPEASLAGQHLWIMMPVDGYAYVNWRITGLTE